MARPKSFDEDKVLDAAVDCFWRNGLNSASIRDLADEMGIAGPSLYNAYGCKRTLFVQALERYADMRMRARLSRLEAELPPKQAILAFFCRTIENSLHDPDGRGCLLVNSAMDVPRQDEELTALVADYLDEIKRFFERCLRAGQAAGDIPAALDVADMAQLLLAVLFGLRLIARIGPERGRLESAARPVLALLETKPSTPNEV
ncbi:MAG: TetR/AcrR family transcriptional regulator [Rhodomicrobium sp.]|nr:TetR/AcrR family transcriptional regulator [Rhodomicrobium sp.]